MQSPTESEILEHNLLAEVRRTANMIVWFEETRGGKNVEVQNGVEGGRATVTVRSTYSPNKDSLKKKRVLKAWISPTGSIIRVSPTFPKTAVLALNKMLSYENSRGQLTDFESEYGRSVLDMIHWTGRRLSAKLNYSGLRNSDAVQHGWD